MEERTLKEKAKSFEEALSRAKGFYKRFPEYKEILEKIFPELKESEDERVINALKSGFRMLEKEHNLKGLGGLRFEKIMSWLEKKGEQKPVDEPKFEVGDMIIHKELGGDYIHNPHKIIQVDILDKKYRLEGGLVAHFSEQEDYGLVEQNPAWSEEDEKLVKNLISTLSNLYARNLIKKETKEKYTNWLKSLKDRIGG